MFHTYILFSEKFDKYYIGFTHDVNRRLTAHNHPKSKGYTKKFQPWFLVYSKEFTTKREAMDYEQYLKSLKSKWALKEIINSSGSSLGSYPDAIGT
jgi:putative endonuclease